MFEFLIDTLEGKPLHADLENIGACYPDDDVIYVFGIPCRLSSARHVAAKQNAHLTGLHCPACMSRNEEIVTCARCGTVKSAPQVA